MTSAATFRRPRGVLALIVLVEAVAGANERMRHYHTGTLPPYEIGPPSMVKLTPDDEAKLQEGQAIMQAMVLNRNDGTRRLLMVKDIKAPVSVITDRLLDYDAYPRMVKGCDALSTYETGEVSRPGRVPLKVMKAEYRIHALHMHFTYFMTHYYDPKIRCMTFHLDYDRRSDLDDSIGYWFLEPTGQEECRAYYSCVTRLRTWVPGPVYALLTKVALKQATIWLDYVSGGSPWQLHCSPVACRPYASSA